MSRAGDILSQIEETSPYMQAMLDYADALKRGDKEAARQHQARAWDIAMGSVVNTGSTGSKPKKMRDPTRPRAHPRGGWK